MPDTVIVPSKVMPSCELTQGSASIAAMSSKAFGAESAQVSPALLQLLLESTGEGIYGIDTEGRCTFINRAAADMLGYRAEQVYGLNMHDLIHHTRADGQHYPKCECPIYAAFRKNAACRIDSEVLWRADGRPFSAEYSSHPILEGDVVKGAVVTIVDITARKRSEAQLVQSNEELERRVQARTQDLSDALEQLRELSAHLASAREDERSRIAREVHDELGSLLVALKMDVHWLAHRLVKQPDLRDKTQGMGRLIDAAVDNVGRIITDLRPSILDHQGLWAALEWHAQEFFETIGLRHDLQISIAAGVREPGGESGKRWSIAVFRIFQEILSNIARHAQASAVRIRLYIDHPPQPMLHLEVRDDGVGVRREVLEHPTRYGVIGMRERAGHFGGKLVIDGGPGQGTRVRLVMPWPPEDEVSR